LQLETRLNQLNNSLGKLFNQCSG